MSIRIMSGVSLMLVACVAAADEMVTDRPDATESSSVVKPGFAQIEAGWLHAEEGESKTDELPGTLIRIGVVNRVELRLGWDGYVDEASGGADGVGDGELGTKVYLREESGRLPEAALLASISLPWGDEELTTDKADPGFRFAMSHTLSESLSLGYNLGAEWTTENDSTLGSLVYSATLGRGLTDALGVFIEVFGDVGLSASGSSHSLDGGITYLLVENLQLDALGGVGLNSDADDWFAGAGVSCRFPR